MSKHGMPSAVFIRFNATPQALVYESPAWVVEN
jgi:hypothetical protein